MTQPSDPGPAAPRQLPPDPAAYDHPRAELARAKGLDQPYIAGGTDPDLERTRRAERRYVRLLVLMIVALVLGGFALGALNILLATPA